MRQLRTSGSVRGVTSNGHSYRDRCNSTSMLTALINIDCHASLSCNVNIAYEGASRICRGGVTEVMNALRKVDLHDLNLHGRDR